MFERRTKIILGILIAFTIVLAVRAMQVQVLNHEYWSQQAVRIMTRPEYIETQRGRLLDRRGRVIAEDIPCIDACVDYRAISKQPDATWVREIAGSRLRNRMGAEYGRADRQQREQLLREEIARVQTDIKVMWETLARIGQLSMDQIDEIRQAIVWKVGARRRDLWYKKYRKAQKEQENAEPSAWYRRWLIEDTQQAPELDQFEVTLAEETQAHVVLRAIGNEARNYLGKNRDRFPGLKLVPSLHRYYPYQDTGAHFIGHISRVAKEDLQEDPNIGNSLRRYWPNDLVGRTGLEALCEPLLRGSRGRVERYLGDEQREQSRQEPIPGMDAATTIDIELQREVQAAFSDVLFEHRDADPLKAFQDKLAMPGAAVVIDVPTGEVLALASYPSYDLNTVDDLYATLLADEINRPLMNRATRLAVEPGSTVKPMVGLGAITQGAFRIDETVECTGFLVIGGRKYKGEGKCWVATNFLKRFGEAWVAHHPVPVPHPTGLLTFSDALERSCNVFFETVADRLGIDGIALWFGRFGLGRPTGIGIAESRGRLPGDWIPPERRRAAAWFSGIGQDQVLATPLQMANVAATIARRGVWMRPRLVPAGTETTARPADDGPDRVDLKLSTGALDAAWQGMINVVNGPAGTGKDLHRDDLVVAGKTGSAQAPPLRIILRDEAGRIVYRQITVRQKDDTGKDELVAREIPDRQPLELGTHAQPNPLAPWYRGTGDNEDRLSHAWVVGFAPADNPKIAFAVLVEYGGGGGATAAYVANRMLDACISHGYLSAKR